MIKQDVVDSVFVYKLCQRVISALKLKINNA